MITTETPVNHRERSVLRAVHAGRCLVSGSGIVVLVIDGVGCCDQFLGLRLVTAGLIASPGPVPAPARLTASGHAALLAPATELARSPISPAWPVTAPSSVSEEAA